MNDQSQFSSRRNFIRSSTLATAGFTYGFIDRPVAAQDVDQGQIIEAKAITWARAVLHDNAMRIYDQTLKMPQLRIMST